jgi:protein ImuA
MSFTLDNEPRDQARASRGFSLARGALHEFYAAAQADASSLSALAMRLGEAGRAQARLWVRHAVQDREMGALHPPGLADLGLDPACMLLVRARDAPSALQAGLEGARCAALGAVIVEIWGAARAYDLTASRRLALAARASGVPVFLLRIGAKPVASAAETRWLARATPSRALAARAPGHPTLHLALLRARNGQEGSHHHLEWNRDAHGFEIRAPGSREPGHGSDPAGRPAAPVSGVVVPVSFHRSGTTRDEFRPQRRAG